MKNHPSTLKDHPFTPFEYQQVLQTILTGTSIDGESEIIEDWISKTFPDKSDRNSVIDLLHQIKAIKFSHYCYSWFVKSRLGYDEEKVVCLDDYGNPISESFIMITPAGKLFIKTLFDMYLKPAL